MGWGDPRETKREREAQLQARASVPVTSLVSIRGYTRLPPGAWGQSPSHKSVINHRTGGVEPPRGPFGQDSKGLAQCFKCSARGDPLRRHELCAGLIQGWPGQGSCLGS